jgi:hypothetical protein
MAFRESPAAEIDRLIREGKGADALAAANAFLAKAPQSFLGRLGRCRANIVLGNFVDADVDVDLALLLSPNDAHAALVRGCLDQRLGRIDAAVARLRPLTTARSPHADEAMITLLDVLYFSHRREEFRALIKIGGSWLKDQRAPLVLARATALDDAAAGAEAMRTIARTTPQMQLKRAAGFEAVTLLDKLHRYREAFDLATYLHAQTTIPFDLETLLVPIAQQAELVKKGVKWITPRVDAVKGVALIASLPRSGTTLLEQMLDRHPLISGIGEHESIDTLCGDLAATGLWPRSHTAIPLTKLEVIQRNYLAETEKLRRDGAVWTFNKSLRTWRAVPAIAAVLPGAVYIQVVRDPRDMATSHFLSPLHARVYGWTASLNSIRQLIEAERSIVPGTLEVLEVAHESIFYEDLVDDPSKQAMRCLKRMNLAMDERVLAPENNAKAVYTISHEQVRKPINRSSIGRWKNYEFAFDSSWDPLVAMHESRRTALR